MRSWILAGLIAASVVPAAAQTNPPYPVTSQNVWEAVQSSGQAVNPGARAVRGQSAKGTDKAGGDISIGGGQSTGSGAGGSVTIDLSYAGSSGTALNLRSSAASFDADGFVRFYADDQYTGFLLNNRTNDVVKAFGAAAGNDNGTIQALSAGTVGLSLSAASNGYVTMPIYMGGCVTCAAPIAGGIRGSSGSGTDIAGGALQLYGGAGTGTGVGGDIYGYVYPAGSSGSSANTVKQRFRARQNGFFEITSDVQYGGLLVNNGTNDIAKLFGESGANDNGSIQLLSGGVVKTSLSASSAGFVSTAIYMGGCVTCAAPGTGALRGSSGSGTNIAGGLLQLIGGVGTGTGAGGGVIVYTAPAGSSGASLNTATARITADSPGNVVIGPAAIATNATDGFLYVPAGAGTPTGAPTSYTGRVPIYVDSTNHKLYFYSGGAWRDAGP